jgi:O-antigen/teichoic acid export membrane protein
MNSSSRTYKALNNVKFSFICQVLYFVLSFVCRTIFIKLLGAEYLGINGLFGNILNILSLAELGFEEALIFRMYQPLATNDREKVKVWLEFCRKMFWYVSIIVGIVGLSIIPFLKYLVQTPQVRESVTLLYLLFLFNSMTSYIYVYRCSLLIADQKSYIVNIYKLIFNIIMNISQIIALILTHNYIVYLLIMIFCNLLNNIFCSRKVTKEYPFLKDRDIKPLAKDEKKKLWVDIKSTALTKVGSMIYEQTDYIMISILLGIVYIGYISNYLIFINIINGAIGQVIGSISASIGNLNVLENEKKKLDAFNKIFFINSWIYGFISVGFMLFLNRFIGEIWLSAEYLLTIGVVYALIIKFYLNGVHFTAHIFRKSMGFFSQLRWVPLAAAVLNIILEVILFKKFGLIGIFVAPVLTRTFIVEPVDVYVTYKNGFKANMAQYYLRHLGYDALFVLLFLVIQLLYSFVKIKGVPGFLLGLLLTTVVFNGTMILIFHRTRMFKELLQRFKTNIVKRRNEQGTVE